MASGVVIKITKKWFSLAVFFCIASGLYGLDFTVVNYTGEALQDVEVFRESQRYGSYYNFGARGLSVGESAVIALSTLKSSEICNLKFKSLSGYTYQIERALINHGDVIEVRPDSASYGSLSYQPPQGSITNKSKEEVPSYTPQEYRETSEFISITVVNSTGATALLLEAVISGSSGVAELIIENELPPGERMKLSLNKNLSKFYDITLTDREGALYLKERIELKEGNQIIVMSEKDMVGHSRGEKFQLEFTNGTGVAINELYVIHKTSGEKYSILARGESIMLGETFTGYWYGEKGLYDLYAVAQSGETFIIFNVDPQSIQSDLRINL